MKEDLHPKGDRSRRQHVSHQVNEWPIIESGSRDPLRVTVLCGYVGAGKSTFLRELIARSEGGPVAVLLHDRSEAGLDDSVCRKKGVEVFRFGETMAELVQGCMGCSWRDSLADAVTAVARMGRFRRLLVECSGLVEPIMVAEVFNEGLAEGAPLAALARLEQIVTVVDARSFWDDVRSPDLLQQRGVSHGANDDRAVSELLVEQVECSTLVVVSRWDQIGPSKRGRTASLLRSLNPDVEVLTSASGSAIVDRVFRNGVEAGIPLSFQPGWIKLIEGEAMPKLRSTRWSAGAFCASRPFHPERLWRLMGEEWDGIERLKGYFWLASQPDRCFLWSQTAGGRFYECIGDWWASIPCADWPDDEAFRKELSRNWSLEFGDRRQALACIGYRLDQARLFQRLASCLLTTAESKLGPEGWRRLEDPFAQAALEIGLQGDERESEEGREDGCG